MCVCGGVTQSPVDIRAILDRPDIDKRWILDRQEIEIR